MSKRARGDEGRVGSSAGPLEHECWFARHVCECGPEGRRGPARLGTSVAQAGMNDECARVEGEASPSEVRERVGEIGTPRSGATLAGSARHAGGEGFGSAQGARPWGAAPEVGGYHGKDHRPEGCWTRSWRMPPGEKRWSSCGASDYAREFLWVMDLEGRRQEAQR